MKEAEKIFDEIMSLSLSDLMRLCAQALDSNVGGDHLIILLRLLQSKLDKKVIVEQIENLQKDDR